MQEHTQFFDFTLFPSFITTILPTMSQASRSGRPSPSPGAPPAACTLQSNGRSCMVVSIYSGGRLHLPFEDTVAGAFLMVDYCPSQTVQNTTNPLYN